MRIIIQQIKLNFAKKIMEKAYPGGISDIAKIAADVLEDCKAVASGLKKKHM